MPDSGTSSDAAIHQTIGKLSAKADQSQIDVTGLRIDVRAIDARLASLPSQIEEIVERLVSPIDGRLTRVETTVSDVQQTVMRWRMVLAILATGAGGAGFLISQFVSVRRLFGVGP